MSLPRPFYEADGVTLYHGDAREIVPLLDGCYRRVIVDPPYGFGAYETDVADWVPDTLRRARAQAETVAVFGYPETLVGWCVALGWVPDEWVTWWPTNKQVGRTKALPRSSEAIAVFGDVPGAQLLERDRSDSAIGRKVSSGRGLSLATCREGDVWRDPSPGIGFNSHLRQHPNEKPIDVLRKLTVLCSEPGDTILDFSSGSGTALIAAREHGRGAIGIEPVGTHCETTARRLSQRVLPLGGTT